jgi:hypothetical protein
MKSPKIFYKKTHRRWTNGPSLLFFRVPRLLATYAGAFRDPYKNIIIHKILIYKKYIIHKEKNNNNNKSIFIKSNK